MDREWYGVYTKRFVCLLLSKSVCLFSLSLYSSFFLKYSRVFAFASLLDGWILLGRLVRVRVVTGERDGDVAGRQVWYRDGIHACMHACSCEYALSAAD